MFYFQSIIQSSVYTWDMRHPSSSISWCISCESFDVRKTTSHWRRSKQSILIHLWRRSSLDKRCTAYHTLSLCPPPTSAFWYSSTALEHKSYELGQWLTAWGLRSAAWLTTSALGFEVWPLHLRRGSCTSCTGLFWALGRRWLIGGYRCATFHN